MKIRITRPDGTVIEAEGTPEECARMVPVPAIQFVPVPQYIPTIWPAYPQPINPTYEPWIVWSTSIGSTNSLGATTLTNANGAQS